MFQITVYVSKNLRRVCWFLCLFFLPLFALPQAKKGNIEMSKKMEQMMKQQGMSAKEIEMAKKAMEGQVDLSKLAEEMMKNEGMTDDEIKEAKEVMKQYGFDKKVEELKNKEDPKGDYTRYYELDEFMYPEKNASKTNWVLKTRITDKNLKAFLTLTQQTIRESFTKTDKEVMAMLEGIGLKGAPGDSLLNAGFGLWLTGSYLPGLYVTGDALLQSSNPHPEDLNNYAAFLLMLGGEDAALPILNKLNAEYPGSSTILNNIGQAWFGLGDLPRAKRYLDSALIINAGNSQALLTKCVIEIAEDDPATATESITQSIINGYSPVKIKMLKKLGGEVPVEELLKDFHPPVDPLGLDDWISRIPRSVPLSVQELEAVKPVWMQLVADINAEIKAGEAKIAVLEAQAIDFEYKMAEDFMENPFGSNSLEPPLAQKYKRILKYYSIIDGEYFAPKVARLNERGEKLLALMAELEAHPPMIEYEEKTKKWYEEHPYIYEGNSEPEPDPCPDFRSYYNEVVRKMNLNGEKKDFDFEWLNIHKKESEIWVYCDQFITYNTARIDLMKIGLKNGILRFIRSEMIPFLSGPPCSVDKQYTGRLENWEDYHCPTNVEFYFFLVGRFKITCNRSEFYFNPAIPGPVGVEGGFTLNDDNELLNWTAGVSLRLKVAEGVKAGFKLKTGVDYENDVVKVEIAPDVGFKSGIDILPLGASVGAKINMEFDKNGMSDYTTEVTSGVAPDIPKPFSTDYKAGVKWNVNAGASGTSKATLKAFKRDMFNPGK